MRISSKIIFFLVTLVSLRVFASMFGFGPDYQYYTVQKEFSIEIQVEEAKYGPSDTVKSMQPFQFKQGMVLVVDTKTNKVKVRGLDGSTEASGVIARSILESPATMKKPYVLQINAEAESKHSDQMVLAVKGRDGVETIPFVENGKLLKRDPPDFDTTHIERNAAGEPIAALKGSEIVDMGTRGFPSYTLAENICFNVVGGGQHCGWTTADHIKSPGGVAIKSASTEYDPKLAAEEAAEEAAEAKVVEQDPEAPMKVVTEPKSCLDQIVQGVDEITDVIHRIPFKESDDHDLLSDSLGSCAVSAIHPVNYRKLTHKNIYDQVALAKVIPKFKASQVGRIKKEDGQPLSEQEFIDMDVLARTLYGEMEICAGAKDHTEYMEGVARVILNRVTDARRHKEVVQTPRGVEEDISVAETPYEGGPQSSKRSGDISKVALAYRQFSMWNDLRLNNVATLDKVLCPPGAGAGKAADIAWENAKDVAMYAILHQKEFEKRTQQVKQRYYTSDMPMPGNREWRFKRAASPNIMGKKLYKAACIEFWNKVHEPAAIATQPSKADKKKKKFVE